MADHALSEDGVMTDTKTTSRGAARLVGLSEQYEIAYASKEISISRKRLANAALRAGRAGSAAPQIPRVAAEKP
jgi:hypothetical protein